jgi:phage baseplate assembly protein V
VNRMKALGLQRQIDAALRPLQRRLRMTTARATIVAVNDATRVQQLQVTALDGERLPDVQRVQQYGFTANPPLRSTAVLLCMGGSRSHPVVIACDHPASRKVALLPGESAQYNDQGDFILIKANGEIVVKASSKVTVDAPTLHALGDLDVDGNLTVTGTGAFGGALSSSTSVSAPTVFDMTGSMQAMRVVYNGHTQSVSSGTAGAPNEQMT